MISESESAQSCPTLSDPMDRSLPGLSIHGIVQARVLESVVIAFSGKVHEQATNPVVFQLLCHILAFATPWVTAQFGRSVISESF